MALAARRTGALPLPRAVTAACVRGARASGAKPPRARTSHGLSQSALQHARLSPRDRCPSPDAFCPRLCRRSNSARAGAAAALRVCAATTTPEKSRGAEKRAQARAVWRTANVQTAVQPVVSPSRILAPPRRRRRPRPACTASRCVGCRRRTARQARRKASTLRCSRRPRPMCRSCCTRRRTRCVSRTHARSVGTRQLANPRAHARCALTLHAQATGRVTAEIVLDPDVNRTVRQLARRPRAVHLAPALCTGRYVARAGARPVAVHAVRLPCVWPLCPDVGAPLQQRRRGAGPLRTRRRLAAAVLRARGRRKLLASDGSHAAARRCAL